MEPSKKRRKISIFLWMLLIFFAVGAGMFLFFMPSPDALARRVADSFAKNTGMPCSISGPANVRFFPAPSVTLYNIRVGTSPEKNSPENVADPGAGGAVEIPALQVRLSYLSLLSGEISPAEIKIHDPIVNLNALVELFSSLDTAEGKSLSRETLDESLGVLRTLRIFGGRFFWKSPEGEAIVVEGVHWDKSFFDDSEIRFKVHGLAGQSQPCDVSIRLGNPYWEGELLNLPVSLNMDGLLSGRNMRPELGMIIGLDADGRCLRLSSGQLSLEDSVIDFEASVSGLTGGEAPVEADIVADMRHISLARWLGGVREMPEILQWLLNDINGNAHLKIKDGRVEIKGKDLVLPGGTVEKASGVFDSAAPSLSLTLETRKAKLESIFPFLKDPAWKPSLDYSLPPFIASESSEKTSPFMYDVSVAAKSAVWEKLKAGNVRVRFSPDKENVLMDASGELYGGRAQADVIFIDGSDDIKIDAVFSGVRVEEGLSAFLRNPVARGAAWGKLAVSADSKDFSAFARTLKGTASVTIRDGAFITEGGAQESISFDSLELKGKASAVAMKSGVFFYNGIWNMVMEAGKSSLAATMEGHFGVRESSGKVVLERVKTTCSGAYPFSFLYDKRPSKFTGAAFISYDQQEESALIDSCSLTFPEFSLSGSGRGTKVHDKKKFSWSGKIHANSSSARSVLTALGQGESLPPGGLNAIALNADYSVKPDEIVFSDCHIAMDKSTARGDIRVHGTRSKGLAFDLSAVIDSVDTDTYFPLSRQPEKSEKKIYDFSALQSLNAKGRLVVNNCRVRRIPFSRLVCNFVAENGMMAVFFDSLFYDGQIKGEWRRKVRASSGKNGNMDDAAGRELKYYLSLSGRKVSLKRFSQDIFGDAYLEGTAAFSGNFQGTVRTSEDLFKTCFGTWEISAEKGFFCSSGSQEVKPPHNWNNHSLTEFRSEKQREPVRNYFDSALLQGELNQGILETKSISVSGPVMSMGGKGKIDFLKDIINMDLDVRLAGVHVPIKVSGPFDRISTNLKSRQFVTGNLLNIFEGIISLPLNIIKLPGKLVE